MPRAISASILAVRTCEETVLAILVGLLLWTRREEDTNLHGGWQKCRWGWQKCRWATSGLNGLRTACVHGDEQLALLHLDRQFLNHKLQGHPGPRVWACHRGYKEATAHYSKPKLPNKECIGGGKLFFKEKAAPRPHLRLRVGVAAQRQFLLHVLRSEQTLSSHSEADPALAV